jgi:hypothetical protein
VSDSMTKLLERVMTPSRVPTTPSRCSSLAVLVQKQSSTRSTSPSR